MRDINRSAIILFCLAALACSGSSDGGVTGPPPRTYPNIGGSYSITGSIAGPIAPLETFTGTLSITQVGDTPNLSGSVSLPIVFGDGSGEFVSTAITGSVTPTGEVQFTVPLSNVQTTWTFTGQYATGLITGTHTLANASLGATFAGPFSARLQ